MQFFDGLNMRYKKPRDAMIVPNNSIPLMKGPQNYSYSGNGMDYRNLESRGQRDWDPNISGKFGGSGVDYNYSQGNFQANRDLLDERGDLGAGYASIAGAQLFNRATGDISSTVEQDLLYALIGSAIEQYIQNSILLWILSAIGVLVWLVTIILIIQLTFPQYVPSSLAAMPAWQKIQEIDIQWWLILAILLTSLVGLNFPSIQNFLMILLGILLIVWFGIRWRSSAQKNWIVLVVGIILLFSGAIREYVDYSANALFMAMMRWPSMVCCILLLIDVFYVSNKRM